MTLNTSLQKYAFLQRIREQILRNYHPHSHAIQRGSAAVTIGKKK